MDELMRNMRLLLKITNPTQSIKYENHSNNYFGIRIVIF